MGGRISGSMRNTVCFICFTVDMEGFIGVNERAVVSNSMYIIVKDGNNINFIGGICKMEGNGGKIMRNIV